MENSGIFLIDKEAGWTSFDVVAWVRSRALVTEDQTGKIKYQILSSPKSVVRRPKIKVGHAGTLDPFATGLLIVLVGKENTSRQDDFMKQDKEYEAVLELGKVSSTGDPEGEIVSSIEYRVSSIKEIEEAINKFIGEIEQVPPIYSAIKIEGKKAYELARKGKEVEMKPRKVTIHDIVILDYSWPSLKIKVSCGSGTYIRSLAKDIGEALKTGAYLTELRRTKIGNYKIEDAVRLKNLEYGI